MFLLKGKSCLHHYTDKWVVYNGSEIGSTYVMTPNAFMKEEEWEKATLYIIKGLRNSNLIVSTNPQWWMLEVFNVFVPHTQSLKSMQYCFNNKIIAVKQ